MPTPAPGVSVTPTLTGTPAITPTRTVTPTTTVTPTNTPSPTPLNLWITVPDPNGYDVETTRSHDTNANITLNMNSNGSWGIQFNSTPFGGRTGSPTSGTWGAGGGDYEVQFTANFSIDNSYYSAMGDDPVPSYSPSTGWLPLSANRSVTISTGHLLGGGSGSGSVNVNGQYDVCIRHIPSGAISCMTFHMEVWSMV